jgi:hypothetical protein
MPKEQEIVSKPGGLIKQAAPLHREITSDAGSVLKRFNYA